MTERYNLDQIYRLEFYECIHIDKHCFISRCWTTVSMDTLNMFNLVPQCNLYCLRNNQHVMGNNITRV